MRGWSQLHGWSDKPAAILKHVMGFRRARVWLLLCMAIGLRERVWAQASATPPEAASATPPGRLILVLPFDNHSGNAALDWVGDSFPDTLNQRLGTSGFLTITREDREYALDHLGLPPGFRPTRATTLRIAQTLDADYVVVGSYTVAGSKLQVQAQVVRVNQLQMSAPLADASDLARLYDVENATAWKVAREIDPHFAVAEGTFLSASAGVPLSAFENYIRGVEATSQAERLKRLSAAVAESPTYTQAMLALGKAQFAARDYDHAAMTLAKVPLADRQALEARFYLGLARFNSARYADAEQAFGLVATRLPLPEVVNNQAVAISRQGRDASALFQRAVTADPNDADYHYNLAVSLLRRRDAAGAKREIDAALRLRKVDAEAQQLRDQIARGGTIVQVSAGTGDAGFAPLERIRRTYSEASFRQAAFQLDQMRQMRMATMKPAAQAVEYTEQGRTYLAQGLLPEAEQEFQQALTADSTSAPARLGLAQVREQSGDEAQARREAESALRLQPGADAHVLLARLDLKANRLPDAANEVKQALALDPKSTAALGLRQALAARGQTIP